MFVPIETNNKNLSKNIFLEIIYVCGVYRTKIIEARALFFRRCFSSSHLHLQPSSNTGKMATSSLLSYSFFLCAAGRGSDYNSYRGGGAEPIPIKVDPESIE